MFERFTPEAQAGLKAATAFAARRGDPAIGPDQLLAGLADPSSGLAAEILAEAGIDQAEVAATLPAPTGLLGRGTPPFTTPAKEALELSLREALNLAHGHIGSGHLLLGLLRLEGRAPALLHTHGVTLDTARTVVRVRSEGARLGGRRRPRRTGRVTEPPTPHERAAQHAAKLQEAMASFDDDAAIRLATEEGSRLQRALAALGVTTEELEAALAEVAAEPVDDGPVVIHLGAGTTLAVAAGPRAAELRALLAAADHVAATDGDDGTRQVEVPALGDAVWATVEGWLTA